jgi:hypothetical protein
MYIFQLKMMGLKSVKIETFAIKTMKLKILLTMLVWLKLFKVIGEKQSLVGGIKCLVGGNFQK